jgi:hypothetical protein
LADGTPSLFTGWVCSYYVHADQSGASGYTSYDGAVTFDSPVIGVIVRGTAAGGSANSGPPYTLDATDEVLGAPGTIYPDDSCGTCYRGLELGDTSGGGWDTLTVSGNQVLFSLSIGGGHDAFRIVVEPV